jgi:uncharacterized protein
MALDFARVIGFQWDEANSSKNIAKHEVTPAEAEQIFFGEPLLVVEDTKHSGVETRFHALGKTESSRTLHVTFTLREDGTKIRIISARAMSRKERFRYAQET